MIDRLGVACLPGAVEALELALLVLDLLPEHLTRELILNDGPLIGGEDGGVEGSSGLLGLFLAVLGLGDLGIGRGGLGGEHRLVTAGFSGPLAQLLDLGWGCLLRLGGGVDLRWLGLLVGELLLGLAVRLHLAVEGCTIVPQLVLDGVPQVEDCGLVPNHVDGVEAAPDGRHILEVAEEVVDVVLLAVSEGPQVEAIVYTYRANCSFTNSQSAFVRPWSRRCTMASGGGGFFFGPI